MCLGFFLNIKKLAPLILGLIKLALFLVVFQCLHVYMVS